MSTFEIICKHLRISECHGDPESVKKRQNIAWIKF